VGTVVAGVSKITTGRSRAPHRMAPQIHRRGNQRTY
jgi:hypothetical protein